MFHRTNIDRSLLNRSRHGFTLIEILTVVVILGIASAIIVPQLGTSSDLKVASAARLVMADLMYAQNKAISSQRPQYVCFDIANKQYGICSAVNPANVYITHPVNGGNYITKFGANGNGTLSQCTLVSASFGTNLTTLWFDEMGVPYAYDPSTNTSSPLSAAGTVVLKCGNNQLTISVLPDTGELTVQ